MLNKIMVIGHLGKDPVNKIGELGNSITTFSVATDSSYIDRNGIRQEQTEWIHVVCFNRIAENCAKYLHKSSLVYVEGSLQTRKWIDQDNNPRYITEVRAQKVTFLDKKSDSVYDGYNRRSEGYDRQEGYGGRNSGYGRSQDYGRQDGYGEQEPYWQQPQDGYGPAGQERYPAQEQERYPLEPNRNKPVENTMRNYKNEEESFGGPNNGPSDL